MLKLKPKKRDFSGVRPTLSKVRQALFNILAARAGGGVEGSVFVDLYAGTGAIGMDAMSRGAKNVYFVEADRRLAAGLKNLLEGCGCRPKAHIAAMKAEDFISKYAQIDGGILADAVFLDPPYASGELDNILPLLSTPGFLASGAVVVAEHSKRVSVPDETGPLKKRKTYRYGDTFLSLYVKEGI